ncbi:site-2 protease family protein [Urbifossiella limnaea]|uniref:Peptidase family M50 n=1 Tax=Urbifossiella limnaea TaxID=2528023 RepID=A0A517XMZ3_9BACT|nr:site-2 protease family protein [Urbifossiella limnaea]QDU18879.1 Peptidase family M50 [Urbifossiella limnaea]
MFCEPDRTGYDLNFRLFGFPVRVHPFFWLCTLIFGESAWNPDRPEFLLGWMAVAFVSFLVHELGHAVAFRACGVGSHVVLYALGGLAVPWDHVNGRGKRVAVSLAGPGAGFVLAGLVWASNQATPWAGASLFTAFLYTQLLWINIVWGVVNLLPVFPLDGGRVSQEVCVGLLGRRGIRVALQLSVGTAGAVAVYSLLCLTAFAPLMAVLADAPWWVPVGGLWTLVLFGVLAHQSYQLLQQLSWTESHWEQ